MALPDQHKLSLEAIAYQGQSPLFKELTLAFDEIIKQNITDPVKLAQFGIGNIIKHHTGLWVDMKFDSEVNAYAEPPVFDGNSPLVARWREIYGAKQIAFLLKGKGSMPDPERAVGSIDLARSRVTGVFSKIPMNMVIGVGLWDGKLTLSGAQVAAIVLHETGHLFTFLEFLTRTVMANFAITSAIQALNGEERAEERVHIVFETAKLVGVKIEDPQALADVRVSDREFATVMIKAMADGPLASATGSSFYDVNGSEFIADQFASRHGAGLPLATALDEMHRRFDWKYRKPKALLYTLEALYAIFQIVMLIRFAGPIGIISSIITFMLMLYNPHAEKREYDTPPDRLRRIKHDAVQALKNPALTKRESARLVGDIRALDELMVGVNENPDVVNSIWKLLTSHRRSQMSQKQFQQELEKTINNDVFVQAAHLKNLA